MLSIFFVAIFLQLNREHAHDNAECAGTSYVPIYAVLSVSQNNL